MGLIICQDRVKRNDLNELETDVRQKALQKTVRKKDRWENYVVTDIRRNMTLVYERPIVHFS